jgi:hypothetical protein
MRTQVHEWSLIFTSPATQSHSGGNGLSDHWQLASFQNSMAWHDMTRLLGISFTINKAIFLISECDFRWSVIGAFWRSNHSRGRRNLSIRWP